MVQERDPRVLSAWQRSREAAKPEFVTSMSRTEGRDAPVAAVPPRENDPVARSVTMTQEPPAAFREDIRLPFWIPGLVVGLFALVSVAYDLGHEEPVMATREQPSAPVAWLPPLEDSTEAALPTIIDAYQALPEAGEG